MTFAAGIPQGEACLGKTTINILEAEFYQALETNYNSFKLCQTIKPSNHPFWGV
jgi:hypothetical protein